MGRFALANEIRELKKLGYDPGIQDAYRVSFLDIALSDNALQSIGSGVENLASKFSRSPEELGIQIFGKLFWLGYSGNLIIVMDVQAIDSYIFIEVPKGHWWFKERSYQTH